jgi:hypothetical protein
MAVDFSVLYAETVPESYSWDTGVPYSTPDKKVVVKKTSSTTDYISGYAPGVKVYFSGIDTDTSETTENSTIYLNYVWNFGDFYNTKSNVVVLSCISDQNYPMFHTYIMPGKYTVSLSQTRSNSRYVVEPFRRTCKGLHKVDWYWNSLSSVNLTDITWDQTKKINFFNKQWDNELVCFGKHCKIWSWDSLQTGGYSTLKWEETGSGQRYEKRWLFEANDTVCDLELGDIYETVQTVSNSTVKTHIIEVKELPPQANIYSVTRPLTGFSPYTARFTPRATKTGSFNIEQIDWDFGDGSPVKIITRRNVLEDPNLIFNNTYTEDIEDPRNYDVVHTFTRNIDQFPVYYPSLTAYASNTHTPAAASTTFGPILLSAANEDVRLIKTTNTESGIVYSLNYRDSVTFVSTTTAQSKNLYITEPPNKVTDLYGQEITFVSNAGTNYIDFPQVQCPPKQQQTSITVLEQTIFLDNDTVTWKNAVEVNGGTVQPAIVVIVDRFIRKLKTNNIWSKIIEMGCFGGVDNLNAAVVKIKSSSASNRILVNVGNNIIESDYTSTGVNAGIKGNQDNKAFICNVEALPQPTSASIGVWSKEVAGVSRGIFGFWGDALGDYKYGIFTNSSGDVISQISFNNELPGISTTSQTQGFWMANTNGATGFRQYFNGAITQTASLSTIQPISNKGLGILARKTQAANTVSSYSNARIVFWFYGHGLSVSQAQQFYIETESFLQQINAL